MKLKKNMEKSKSMPASKPSTNMPSASHSFGDKPKLIASHTKSGSASVMPIFGDAPTANESKASAAKSSFGPMGPQPAFAAAVQPSFANQFASKGDPKSSYSFVADSASKPKSDQQADTNVVTKSSPPPATAFSFTKASANAEIKSILGAATSKPADSLPSMAADTSLFGGQTVFKTPSITAFNSQVPSAIPFGGAWNTAPPMTKPTAVAFGNNSSTTAFGTNQPSSSLPSSFGSINVSQSDSSKIGGNIDKPIPLLAAKAMPITGDNNVNKPLTSLPSTMPISLVTKPKDKENVPTSATTTFDNVATIQPQPSKSIFDTVIEASVKSPTPVVAINKTVPPATASISTSSISALNVGQAPVNVTVNSSATSGFTFSHSELPKTNASGKRIFIFISFT